MEILGYLITIASLQSKLYDTINDISIRTGDVKTLAEDLSYEISGNLNKLKKIEETGYIRDGHIGKYYSQNLRDYFFRKNVSSEVEGIVITIDFKDSEHLRKHSSHDDAVSIFLHKDEYESDEVQDAVDTRLDQIDRRYGFV